MKTIIAIIALLAVSVVATSANASDKAIHKLIEDYYAVYHTAPFDVDKFVSFYTEDCTFEDPTFRINLKGRAAVREMMVNAGVGKKEGHWGVQWKIHRRIVTADQAVIEGVWSGNFKDKPFAVRFATILTLRNGKIASQLDFFDAYTWSQQVGLAK